MPPTVFEESDSEDSMQEAALTAMPPTAHSQSLDDFRLAAKWALQAAWEIHGRELAELFPHQQSVCVNWAGSAASGCWKLQLSIRHVSVSATSPQHGCMYCRLKKCFSHRDLYAMSVTFGSVSYMINPYMHRTVRLRSAGIHAYKPLRAATKLRVPNPSPGVGTP